VIETRYRKSVEPIETDGRDIDSALGVLVGEGAQQVAGRIDPHTLRAAETLTELPMPRPGDPAYYDRPMLKEPVWESVVPLYYYFGGAAGASLVIGAAAQLDRSGRLNALIRRCHLTGIAGSAISGGLLVFDLGRRSGRGYRRSTRQARRPAHIHR